LLINPQKSGMKNSRRVCYLFIIGIGMAFTPACNNAARDNEIKGTQAEIDSLQQQKRELTSKLEDQKKKIDEQIAELKAKKAMTEEKKTQDFYDESINRLNKTNDSLQVKMDRFEKETTKDWKHLKKEMDEAFDSANKEFNDVGRAIEDFFRK
jgi:septal ring factor EnvC (AmiA/AmiB activator)